MNNKILIEFVIGVVIVALGIFLTKSLLSDSVETRASIDLGANFTLLTEATRGNSMSFDTSEIINSKLSGIMQDFTQTIGRSDKRGRDDPFKPYDNTRPIR